MKKLLLLAWIIMQTSALFAQKKTISLHPQVGDTINLKEKEMYLLFPEIDSEYYNYGVITKTQEQYQLNVIYNGICTTTNLDSLKINEYANNIEKLSNYYVSITDTLNHQKAIVASENMIRQLGIDTDKFISPSLRKKIKKDAIRYQSLESDAKAKGLIGNAKDDYINQSGVIIFTK